MAGAPGWPEKVCETGERSAERAGREKVEETEMFREWERACRCAAFVVVLADAPSLKDSNWGR